ncbi:MAG: electron transfer flavoprotein subunit beta/FixA family protein [Lachnospiraceae bacterium]
MRIIVCVKQVPDTNEVKINRETGTLIRDGVPSIINPDDKNAIEEAIRIKETNKDVRVTILSMGPPQAANALREAIAMGADDAILLGDRAFAGSDTWATATILAAALRKIGAYDLIFCGRQAIDGDTAQVGPEIAEFLDLPQITYAKQLNIKGDTVFAHRSTEDGHFEMECKMPVLVTTIKELNTPRYPHMRGIYKAFSEEANITNWTMEDIEVDRTQIGVKNSPTNVYKSFVPVKEFHCEKHNGSPKELADLFVTELMSQKLI